MVGLKVQVKSLLALKRRTTSAPFFLLFLLAKLNINQITANRKKHSKVAQKYQRANKQREKEYPRKKE